MREYYLTAKRDDPAFQLFWRAMGTATEIVSARHRGLEREAAHLQELASGSGRLALSTVDEVNAVLAALKNFEGWRTAGALCVSISANSPEALEQLLSSSRRYLN